MRERGSRARLRTPARLAPADGAFRDFDLSGRIVITLPDHETAAVRTDTHGDQSTPSVHVRVLQVLSAGEPVRASVNGIDGHQIGTQPERMTELPAGSDQQTLGCCGELAGRDDLGHTFGSGLFRTHAVYAGEPVGVPVDPADAFVVHAQIDHGKSGPVHDFGYGVGFRIGIPDGNAFRRCGSTPLLPRPVQCCSQQVPFRAVQEKRQHVPMFFAQCRPERLGVMHRQPQQKPAAEVVWSRACRPVRACRPCLFRNGKRGRPACGGFQHVGFHTARTSVARPACFFQRGESFRVPVRCQEVGVKDGKCPEQGAQSTVDPVGIVQMKDMREFMDQDGLQPYIEIADRFPAVGSRQVHDDEPGGKDRGLCVGHVRMVGENDPDPRRMVTEIFRQTLVSPFGPVGRAFGNCVQAFRIVDDQMCRVQLPPAHSRRQNSCTPDRKRHPPQDESPDRRPQSPPPFGFQCAVRFPRIGLSARLYSGSGTSHVKISPVVVP